MKNKPTRHKGGNTFKFQPFAERIANIDVDVFHRIGHRYEEDSEEVTTYFHQALGKWNVLNLSESYDALRKELPLVQTLPLLLIKKEEIVATISKHIHIENTLSLQPTLELVVALARDLQQDFYPFYPRLLHLLIDLLKTRDADQLEWTFTCLAYLFKFLWRCLLKDLDIVFDNLIPLLADNKPTYINNFAAESFAFVARKVKDRKAFLSLVLETLKERPDGTVGCGRLLFEVMRGVPGQFHSSVETILPLLFNSLADETLSQELLFELLTHTITPLLIGIRPKKCDRFWSIAIETLHSFLSAWKNDNSERKGRNILLMLKLLQQAVDYKDCLMLTDPVPVVKELVELLKLDQLPLEVVSVTSDVGASLLLSCNTHLSQEHSSRIMVKILAVPHPNILMGFVVKVFDYSGFEALVLPHLLNHCQQQSLSRDLLQLLTKLILHKAPPCKTGIELKDWQRYPLDFSTSSISNTLMDTMNVTNVSALANNMEESLCCLLLLPHLHPLDKKNTIIKLKNIIEMLCKTFSEEGTDDSRSIQTATEKNTSTNKLLFLLATVLEAVVHIVDSEALHNVCELDLIINTLLPYAVKPGCVGALRALDIFLTAFNLGDMSEELCISYLTKLHDSLVKNLSSPFHDVRLMTSHLFSLFERSPEGPSSDSVIHWSLFSLCLAAELVPATIHEYRDKQQHLQNLEFSATQITLSKNPHFNKVPLQYLLGIMYVNFQLLWEPTSLLIASHALGMKKNEFWSLFLEQLQAARQHVRVNESSNPSSSLALSEDAVFLAEFYTSMHEFTDKPDYVNYRILLWKAMLHFPDVCLAKTKDVSPLFLSFLEEEYLKSNAGVANTWNVKLADLDETEMETDANESHENQVLDTIKKKLLNKPPKSVHNLGSRTGKSLLSHMAIFSKFKNPKAVCSEPELRKIYFNFLSNKNPAVQKLALDCIMTYKHPYLVPYREHLYGLLDEKTFKSELTLFRVDTESKLIQETHRADLMPVIMRIMYSKMMTKVGTQRGGNSAGQFKRSIVLRFLAGCHEDELITFVEMAFRLYTEHTQGDVVLMVDTIMDSIDLENVIPPKRLQSSINLLGVIFDQFGGLMGKRLLPYLFRILLCISANVAGILSRRDSVHGGYLPILRSVRTLCLETAARFFDRFNKFEWTSADIDATFNALVFPWLDKLAIEGIHSPTALLKLLLVWSEYPRYFVLLAKHVQNDTSLTPLPYIMQLLQGNKTHPSVVNAIMEFVERLLTLGDFNPAQDEEEEEDVESEKTCPLTVNFVLPTDHDAIAKLTLSEKINYGSCLLLSHIPSILERLRMKLIVKNKSLNRLELVVLSRVSELVWDPATSDTLLKLLMPLLMKKSGAGDEVTVPLLTTLIHLIKNLDDPEKYIRGLAPLFGQVSGAGPRKMLCKLMETIASHCSNEMRATLVASLAIVGELNAWDKKWLDQPDFMQRLDAFKRVNEMIEAKAVDFDLGLIVIHTCFHYLKVEKDLSLRDSAGYCLKQLAPALCKQYSKSSALKDILINNTVLRLVRFAIRDNTDNLYNEAIGLLGAMSRECQNTHPVLNDLYCLTSKEDPEVDFFENLQHLQSHRKARALLKFCQVTKTLPKAPSPRTLTQFILPIASSFLMSEKYAAKHTIVDAAIETVGAVCRLLPWTQYNLILRYYLTKLRTVVEYQRQLVRVVVEILDAFHFDLAKAQNEVSTDVKNVAQDCKNKNTELIVEEQEKRKSVANSEECVDEENLDETKEGGLLEELDENLEDALAASGKTEEPGISLLAVDGQISLTRSAAVQATTAISRDLLPQLYNCMAERSGADTKHKFNRKKGGEDRDEEDVLRVPLALAVVKLLKRLPKEVMDQNLPGIFMKLCTFLKSKLESIRRVTRHTLQKIMITLGPGYLPYILNEMCSLLTRGFHVHVLVYTIHAILVSLKDLFKPGDVDLCLKSVLECCRMDVFGATAEEKNISGITGKVQEARSTKSFDTLQIVAQFVTEKCFTDLLIPIQNVLVRSHSFKATGKASECLRHIVVGLSLNKFVSLESLLMFTYGTVSESIPELKEEKKEPMTEAKRKQLVLARPDTFLIVPAPRNRHGVMTAQAKTATKTNAHILVEFGLKLFLSLLKREKLRSPEYRPFLDPIVPIISDCIESKHIKLTTLSLQCLSSIFKMDLPTMKDNISKIVASIFSLLHKYASAGLGKGENHDLVTAAFKAVVVLVRDVSWHVIDRDQLKALLLYAEQDLHGQNKQATAFAMLRAILARKLVVPEVADIMRKVADLSIVSETASVRLQSRQVFHQYLMDYPVRDKLEYHLSFYISQLSYEIQSGRESALEMLHTIISTFPINQLNKESGLLFVTLAARLENDDVPKCRKMVAQCIMTMLERLDENVCDQLFDIVVQWLKDKKVAHRRLASQLCGIFITVEKASFEKRLTTLLPDLVSQFGRGFDDNRPGQFVRAPKQEADNADTTEVELSDQSSDHHMFQVLQVVLKICEFCPLFLSSPNWQGYVAILAENAHALLTHDHEWVRLASCQVLGHVFASLNPGEVAAHSHTKSGKSGFLSGRTAKKLKALTLDMCAQLHPEVGSQLADQVLKNLVFLGRVMKDVQGKATRITEPDDEANSDDDLGREVDVSLLWMVGRMRRVVNTEVVQFPKSTVMRTSVFKWIGAVALDSPKESIIPLLQQLLAPLVREMAVESETKSDLQHLATDVAKVIKNKVGMEEYTHCVAVLERKIVSRRSDRKKLRTREAITNPELAAKRKIDKQLKKKDAKKRRIDEMKGRKVSKKKKRKEVDMEIT